MTITTTVGYSRSLTTEEKVITDNQIAILVAEGVTDGTYIDGPTHFRTRPWTTIEAANAWIAYVTGGTFVPGPISAIVNT